MVMQGHQDVADRISVVELKQIVGGRSISGTIINAFTTAFKTVYSFHEHGAQRRLARAVRPHDGMRLTIVNYEVDTF